MAVLGETGYNFGAGMTGGFAYVLDEDRSFVDKFNPELVEIHRITSEASEGYATFLRDLIAEFTQETSSEWGAELLENYDDYLSSFWLVKPKAASLTELLERTVAAPQ